MIGTGDRITFGRAKVRGHVAVGFILTRRRWTRMAMTIPTW